MTRRTRSSLALRGSGTGPGGTRVRRWRRATLQPLLATPPRRPRRRPARQQVAARRGAGAVVGRTRPGAGAHGGALGGRGLAGPPRPARQRRQDLHLPRLRPVDPAGDRAPGRLAAGLPAGGAQRLRGPPPLARALLAHPPLSPLPPLAAAAVTPGADTGPRRWPSRPRRPIIGGDPPSRRRRPGPPSRSGGPDHRPGPPTQPPTPTAERTAEPVVEPTGDAP